VLEKAAETWLLVPNHHHGFGPPTSLLRPQKRHESTALEGAQDIAETTRIEGSSCCCSAWEVDSIEETDDHSFPKSRCHPDAGVFWVQRQSRESGYSQPGHQGWNGAVLVSKPTMSAAGKNRRWIRKGSPDDKESQSALCPSRLDQSSRSRRCWIRSKRENQTAFPRKSNRDIR
jgi:hypothetical protein